MTTRAGDDQDGNDQDGNDQDGNGAMSVRITLAGDTMLGRNVAKAIAAAGPRSLIAPEVAERARDADLAILNLECCISTRGEPWPDPYKPFFFRAPPAAVDFLVDLGVGCVTLANNHALDFGPDALADTRRFLTDAGIAVVGAGQDLAEACRPAILRCGPLRLAVLGLTDHPLDYAATRDRAGVAYADLWTEVPDWVLRAVREAAAEADAVIVTPHWGPNFVMEPLPHVRTAARAIGDAGATLIAGHSSHLVHGVSGRTLYDLGDFLDDYAVHPVLRNDLGLLWRVTLDRRRVTRVEGYPIALDYCRTRRADDQEASWLAVRLRDACRMFGTEVTREGDTLVLQVEGA